MSSYDNENTSSCFGQKQLAYRTSKKVRQYDNEHASQSFEYRRFRGWSCLYEFTMRSLSLFFFLFCVFLKLRSRPCVISGCLSRDLFQRLCQQKSTRVCYEERHTDFYTAYIGLFFFFFHSVNIFRGPQLSCNHHRDENRIATEKSRKICDRRFSQQTHTGTHTYIQTVFPTGTRQDKSVH